MKNENLLRDSNRNRYTVHTILLYEHIIICRDIQHKTKTNIEPFIFYTDKKMLKVWWAFSSNVFMFMREEEDAVQRALIESQRHEYKIK